MSQTTAPREQMREGALGLVAHHFGPSNVLSKINSTDTVFFGRAVVHKVADGEDGVEMPTAAPTFQTLEGISMATRAIIDTGAGIEPGYQPMDSINVARKGYVWVKIDVDIVKGDPVHILSAAGKEGVFSNAGGFDATGRMRWERGGLAADGIALLEINLV